MLTDERVAAFREACEAAGVECQATLDVDHPEPRRARPQIGASVIAYGSKSVLAYAVERAWKPGVWNSDAFDYRHAQEALGDVFVNSDAAYATVADAETVAARQGWDDFFVRPFDDNKSFAGMASGVVQFPSWRKRMLETGYLSQVEVGVIVASLKPIAKEWRLVMVEGEPVAASLYRCAGQPSLRQGAPDSILALARTAAQRYRPQPVFIMDLAEMNTGGLAVVELNCFNSADLYECNIMDVVTRVSELAR